MSNDEENVVEPVAGATPSGAPKIVGTEGGRASWEEPNLPFRERIQKHWRLMLVHLWGPAGSIVFHIAAVGVLLTFATNKHTTESTSEPVVLETNAKPELEKPPEPDKVKPPEPDNTVDTPQENNIGLSTVEAADIGGSGTQDTGTGLGTGDPNLPDKGFEISTTVKSRLVLKGLYAGRTAGGRKGALGLYGKGGAGGAATEAAVLRALRWLKKNQESDGSWKGDKMAAPVAMTGFALLAYLAHGETPQSPEFGATVKRSIDFLLASLGDNGKFKEVNGYTQAIATYALCEAYGLTQHPSIKDGAIKAITVIVNNQHANGGFNYCNAPEVARDDSSVMAWCCQAMKAAKMAGLESDVSGLEAAIKKAILGFKLNADPNGGFGYTGPGHTGLSGAGALCMQLLGAPREPEVTKTLKFLDTCTFSFATPDQQPYGGGSQVYYWYYITQAKFHHSPETFAAWNKQFSPELCKQQQIEKNAIEGPDGKMVDIGHWDSPSGKAEHTGGTVQTTSLCCLMLEVYYRYLPSFKKIDTGPDDVVAAAPKAEDVNVKIK